MTQTTTRYVAGGEVIDRHRHPEHQLIYVSAGVAQVTTAAGSWVVAQHRAVWIPAGTWHEHRFYGSSRFHTLAFPESHTPLRTAGPVMVGVSPLLAEVLVACADGSLPDRETAHLRVVVADQLRRSEHQPLSLPAPRDPRLAEACRLASLDLTRTLPLASLAERVATSERTLSRLFRQELGMTYPQWRTNVRVLNAAILLAGGMPVTRAAHECGWRTTSHFVETFSRHLGQTPGAYARC